MIQPLFNWRTGIAIIAIAIITGTIFYSQFLARKIATEERQKAAEWVEASQLFVNDTTGMSDRLVSIIISENKTIPIIHTDEKGNILEYANLDSAKVASDSTYIQRKLKEFRSANDPIEWINPTDTSRINFYFYGHSSLLNQVRYYPVVQLLIVGLFIIITITALNTSYRSTQNQVWAGMAKETAHQLGTPLSSLEGWIEMLKENKSNDKIVTELEKDVERLKLVSDRFGKIGSLPQLEEKNVMVQLDHMLDYIRKRAPGKVTFSLRSDGEPYPVKISPPLFDWVIENLLKNALDAMEGKGSIDLSVHYLPRAIHIDVADTGKGIAKQHLNNVFKPGFTTKKRGWGLGLSLSKRIIEQFHQGQLFVKHTEPGKGTTFRIVFNK